MYGKLLGHGFRGHGEWTTIIDETRVFTDEAKLVVVHASFAAHYCERFRILIVEKGAGAGGLPERVEALPGVPRGLRAQIQTPSRETILHVTRAMQTEPSDVILRPQSRTEALRVALLRFDDWEAARAEDAKRLKLIQVDPATLPLPPFDPEDVS